MSPPYYGPSPSAFVGNGDFMTFAQLLANFPPSAATKGFYARVTDLYGTQTGVMVCGYDSNQVANGGYFWQPTRPDSTNGSASAYPSNTPLTILPITMPSFIRFSSAALTLSVTHTISPVNAYPGCRVRMLMPGLLGIFGITIAGLVSGTTVPLVTGTPREFIFDGTAFQTYA